MEDREILKRLAEIEGHTWVDNSEEDLWVIRESPEGFSDWNPLTKWSDLGPLIEKHKVDTLWNPSDLDALDDERGLYWETEIYDYSDPNEYKVRSSANHPSLPHAICLAIIEAHK